MMTIASELVHDSTPRVPHANHLRERARRNFSAEISRIGAQFRKVLIVEKSLISILDMTFKFSELEDMGIARIVEWSSSTDSITAGLGSDLGEGANTALVFLMRSMSMETLPLLTRLGSSRKPDEKSQPNFHILFVPYVSCLARNRLTAAFATNGATIPPIRSLPDFDSVMIEDDVISLHIGDDFLARTECQNEPTNLVLVAKFLKKLETEFGVGVGHSEVEKRERKFRKINAIGPNSKQICDQFLAADMVIGEEISPRPAGGEDGMPGISRVGGLTTIGSVLRKSPAAHLQWGVEDSMDREDVVDESSLLSEGDEIPPQACIDSVVLIDRRSDVWSLLCSQFTYESLIDEKFGIENNRVKFSSSGSTTTPEVTMNLSRSSDPMFDEIRDVSVSQIGQLLSRKANYISECYKEKDALKSISEIKDFMEKFKVIQSQHSSLTNHVSLATECSEFARHPDYTYILKIEDQIMSMSKPVSKILWKIEKLIRKGGLVVTPSRILRLVCLASIIFEGKAIVSAGVEKVLRSIVSKFGVDMIRIIVRLEQAGLLRYNNPVNSGVVTELIGGASKWPKIREEFKVIIDGGDGSDPSSAIAEPYSGFVPISVRLVQLLNSSWKTCAEKLNLLRGPAIEFLGACFPRRVQ